MVIRTECGEFERFQIQERVKDAFCHHISANYILNIMAACREKQQGPDEDKWWLPHTDAKTCLLTAGCKYIMTIFDDTILASVEVCFMHDYQIYCKNSWTGRDGSWNQNRSPNSDNVRYADNSTLLAKSKDDLNHYQNKHGKWQIWYNVKYKESKGCCQPVCLVNLWWWQY